MTRPPTICIAQGCNQPVRANTPRAGWCNKHWFRWYKGTRGVRKPGRRLPIHDPNGRCLSGRHVLTPGDRKRRRCGECERTAHNEWARQKYATDAKYAARKRQYVRQWAKDNQYHITRYRRDPEYREQLKTWVAEWKRERNTKAKAFDEYVAATGVPVPELSKTAKARAYDAFLELAEVS